MKVISAILLLLLLTIGIRAQRPVRSAEIKPMNGRPVIHINNEPYLPMLYALTHAYGGRWSWEEVPARNINQFARKGVKLFQADIWLQDIWSKDKDMLDISLVQRQIKGIVDQAPDGYVFLRLHVNAPFWWNEAHPEEVTQYANGPIDDRKYGPPFHNEDGDVERPLRASLASQKWKQEASDKVIEFCKRLSQTPEGAYVTGLHLAGGIFGEWHYWGFIENDPDTGPAMTKYFREWLKLKYKTDKALQRSWHTQTFTLENATVPGTAERNESHDGAFKDPTKSARVIDYFTAQQQVVADVAEDFCRIAKENWPRPLITGIFYGYYHMTFNRQTVGGHLFIEKMLNSPYVDYLAAPQTYWGDSRGAGGSGNSRGIIESALLHGKLWLDEMDNGYLHKKVDFDNIRYSERYDEEYEAILKRNALFPLMRGIGLWYYDFGLQKGFGWWDNDKYLNAIGSELRFFDQRLKSPSPSVADALIVWSMDNFYYLKPGWLPISMDVIDKSIEEAMRCGVAFDQIYDFDLEKVNLDQYKAVIFMNSYILKDHQKKLIRDKVAQNGRTLIWNYMPGFTDGQSLSDEFVKEITGISTKRISIGGKPEVTFLKDGSTYTMDKSPEPLLAIVDPKATTLAVEGASKHVTMAVRQFQKYRSVFSTIPLHGANVFRQLMKDAGCHVYNDHNDFTYAKGNLLLLHTREGGKKRLNLKSKAIDLDMPANSTWLIDATTGEVLLK